jgi:hypothetical protein
MSNYVTVLAQALAHVGLWLPLTVALCVLGVMALRRFGL